MNQTHAVLIWGARVPFERDSADVLAVRLLQSNHAHTVPANGPFFERADVRNATRMLVDLSTRVLPGLSHDATGYFGLFGQEMMINKVAHHALT